MKLLRIVLVLMIIFGGMVLVTTPLVAIHLFQTVSYYQGISPSFVGIEYNGLKYTKSNTHGASLFYLDGNMAFDPDDKYFGVPNIYGHVDAIAPKSVGWSIRPAAEWTWTINETSGGKTWYHTYKMTMYECSWTVKFWADTDDAGVDLLRLGEERDGGRIHDAQIWIKLDPQNFAYFEGSPEEVYFVPAKIECSGIEYGEGLSGADMQLFPNRIGDELTIYDSLFAQYESISEKQLLEYRGTKLDPNVFKPVYYTRISLIDFGVTDWWELSHKIKPHSVALHFTVDVFVVGHWKVADPSDIEPKPAPVPNPKSLIQVLSEAFASMATNPLSYVWAFIVEIFVLLVVVGLIAVFAPQFLVAIGKLISGG